MKGPHHPTDKDTGRNLAEAQGSMTACFNSGYPNYAQGV